MNEPPKSPLLSGYPDQRDRTVMGMISGTSADGVDVALVKFSATDDPSEMELLSFDMVAYPNPLRDRVMAAAADRMTLRQTALLNTELGEFFAAVAQKALPDKGCDLICSHGQTVCHLPEQHTTLQLGEGSIISNRTGIVTINDLRPADLALGGQGAPLVPLFDSYVLGNDGLARVAVNLGGIANITVVADERPLLAFDTGPANCVSDALCRQHGVGGFDAKGALAATGQVREELLEELLRHPYFARVAPKSTGLEDFGEEYAKTLPTGVPLADLLRTVIALSAQALVEAIFEGIEGVDRFEVVCAGGGTANETLMVEINQRLEAGAKERGLTVPAVRRFSDFGVPEDAREAMAFAFLGDRTARGLAGAAPSATGARQAAILGKINFPSNSLHF